MNVLFMSLGSFNNLNDSSVHLDILKRFAEDHEVWLVCKNENKPTIFTEEFGIHVLRVHTGKLKKVRLIQKGINTIRVESQFKNAIAKYLSGVKFDLILYTTPPITFVSAVKYVKNRDGAVTYLMLKDIFPQNAVDIGMMSTVGLKGLLYRYFRKKEKSLYRWSDYIGCMSPANCEYILTNNSETTKDKVEICPNTTIIRDMSCSEEDRIQIRLKYGIPLNKTVFVYGGNLGKPQNIPFVIECMWGCANIQDVYFLIVGAGTEYHLLDEYVKTSKQNNLKLMQSLPREDYDKLIGACDVGLIFLDHRFTVPNFPSRLLSYMQAKIPVLAVTDLNTDIGKVITEGGFGWWCESNDFKVFESTVKMIVRSKNSKMGIAAFKYLIDNYSVDRAYQTIIKKVEAKDGFC